MNYDESRLARILSFICHNDRGDIEEFLSGVLEGYQMKHTDTGSWWDNNSIIPKRINIYGSYLRYKLFQSRYTCPFQYFVHAQPVRPGDIVIATIPMGRIIPADNSNRNVYVKGSWQHPIVGIATGRAVYILDGIHSIGTENLDYYTRIYESTFQYPEEEEDPGSPFSHNVTELIS